MTTTFMQSSSYKMAAAAFGAVLGCSLYFILPFEVDIQVLFYFSVLPFLLCAFLLRVGQGFFLALCMMTTLAFWMLTAYKVQHLDTVFLPPALSGERYWVVGEIEQIEKWEKRARITILTPSVYGVDKDDTPTKVRISGALSTLADFKAGMWIAMQAKLLAVEAPQYAGAFDFRRYSYLEGIGATGYVMGEVYRTSQPDWEERVTPAYYIERFRQKVHERIMSYALSGSALSSSLLTGIRDRVREVDMENYRASGLSHILAISGLHIGLVGAMVFFFVRQLLLCFPNLALKISVKRVAAVFGLLSALFYMLLAGATLPTVRAALMLSFLFIGILFKRFRLSLRSLFLTVLIVLTFWPEDVISPSFQMSFAATFVLLLFASRSEMVEEEEFQGVKSAFKAVYALRYFKGVWMTSLLASLATIPIAAWHFSTISLSGVFANLLAIPLTAFWILPSGMLSLILMPVGLDAYPLLWMSHGVDLLSMWAAYMAGHSFASSFVDISVWWVVCLGAIMSLILMLARRFKALVACLACTVLLYVGVLSFQRTADVYVLSSGDVILLKAEKYNTDKEGRKDNGSVDLKNMYFLIKGGEGYDTKRMLQYFVKDKGIELIRKRPQDMLCDTLGCSMLYKGMVILLPPKGEVATVEDCVEADLILQSGIVYTQGGGEPCPLYQKKGFSEIYLRADGGVDTVRFTPHKRAWTLDASY